MDSSFASPVGKEKKTTANIRPIPHRQSTDTLATVDRNISAEMSAECRPTYRPIVSTDSLLTKTACRPTLGRYVGRVSVAISADSIDRHSVDRCLKYTWSVSNYMKTRIKLLHKQALHPAGIFKSSKSRGLQVSLASISRSWIIKELLALWRIYSGRPAKSSVHAKSIYRSTDAKKWWQTFLVKKFFFLQLSWKHEDRSAFK